MKELTVKEIESILGYEIKIVANKPAKQLADIPAGETFKVGDLEFIVLEQSGDTTAVILKDLLYSSKEFGKNNNYNGSYVDNYCNDFAKKLMKIVDKGNVVEHTVDLTADDGLKDYGTIKRCASLLTCDLYRRYRYVLKEYPVDNWYWLATAYSTDSNGYSSCVRCVSLDGTLYLSLCNRYCFGVRPFCILKSNILVS